MSRLRSAAVIALLLVAAPTGSSAPDDIGNPSRLDVARVTGTVALSAEPGPADGSRSGKRWAVLPVPAGTSADPGDGRVGKRWV